MGFLLRLDGFVDAKQLLLNVLDLIPRGFRLLGIHLRDRRPRQPPMSAVHNRHHHLQIA
jgi:hypothetical protein